MEKQDKMKDGKDVTGTIPYHLEVCDECICECPIKLREWLKQGDFGKYVLEGYDDCNCFQNENDKREHFKQQIRELKQGEKEYRLRKRKERFERLRKQMENPTK